jgi:hypothetical protein
MVSLVVNEYPTTVKTKKTISMDTTTVKEVVYVKDNEGTSKANARRGGTTDEETFDDRPPGVMGIAEGDVEGRQGVASKGTDGDGGDAEETGLEEVSGREMRDMIILSLKQDNSREVGRCGKELILGDEV